MPKLQRLDVMVSSTSKDLPAHREQADRAIRRAGMHPIVREDLTASLGNALDVSLALVEEAEVYVGVFGHRYGYCPDDPRNPDKRSITELEYRHALKLGMPILIFVMHDDHPGPDTNGLSAVEARQVHRSFYEVDPDGEAKLTAFKNEFTFLLQRKDLREAALWSFRFFLQSLLV